MKYYTSISWIVGFKSTIFRALKRVRGQYFCRFLSKKPRLEAAVLTARGNVSLAVAGFAIATLGLSATASAVTVPTLDCSIPNASISGLGPVEQNDTITVNALGLLTGDTVRFEFTRAATGNGNPNFSLVSSGSATVDPVSYNPIVLNKPTFPI